MELSKGDKFPHVHVSTYSLKTRKTTNYRINCDDYDEFDGHCTLPASGVVDDSSNTMHAQARTPSPPGARSYW